MKLLLLLALLTAGATKHNIRSEDIWQFSNAFSCIISLNYAMKKYTMYGCYCGALSWSLILYDLNRCCRIRDQCYDQINKLGNCASLINNPYTTSYLHSCSGEEIICSDENKVCESFICNCDQQAAICFSKTSFNKQYKGKYC